MYRKRWMWLSLLLIYSVKVSVPLVNPSRWCSGRLESCFDGLIVYALGFRLSFSITPLSLNILIEQLINLCLGSRNGLM